MVYGAVVRTPVEGAEPVQFDDVKARSVADVITTVKLPYGIGIIAKTPWAAFAARQIVADSATWTKTAKGWTFNTDKGLEAFVAAARDLSQPATDWLKVGDAAGELSKTIDILDGVYLCDCAYHAQMEPLNAVASVSATGNSAEVWTGTQSPTTASEATAEALGISRNHVRVNYMLMGGGFGRRGPRDSDFTVDAVLLSKAVARPVKVMWTREDDIHNGRFRPLSAHLLRAGFDSAGDLVAVQHRNVGDRVTPDFDPVRYEWLKHRDGILMAGGDLAGYDVPHQLVEEIHQDTGTRTAPLRGIGFLANKFAVETFIDELALKRSLDPLEFRLRLMKKNPRGAKLLERVAEMAEWQRKRADRGLGVAFINYSGTQLASIAEVSVDRTSGAIRVHEFWCTIDCGVAVQPDNIIAQTEGSIIYGLGAALTERITFKYGVVEQSNFYDYLVPRMNTVPIIHVELLQTKNPPTGVGQMGAPLGAPVVGNAIANLTGVRLRHSPFTPERVKIALG
jgi:isoquinoline 1-oxidoreductase beta subunit